VSVSGRDGSNRPPVVVHATNETLGPEQRLFPTLDAEHKAESVAVLSTVTSLGLVGSLDVSMVGQVNDEPAESRVSVEFTDFGATPVDRLEWLETE
jgi:cephalosporin hydroxylase